MSAEQRLGDDVSGPETAPHPAVRAIQGDPGFFAAITAQIPYGVMIIGAPDGQLVYANDAARSFYGDPPPEVAQVAEYSAQYVAYHPDGRAYASTEWPAARALLHGASIRDELMVFERPDGVRRSMRVSASPVSLSSAGTDAVLVTFADITDELARRNQLEHLHELSRALSAVLDPADVAIAVLDRTLAHFGAFGGVVLLHDADDLVVLSWRGLDAAQMAKWQRYPIAVGTPGADAVLHGAPVFLETTADWVRDYPQWLHWVRENRLLAYVAVPLRVQERTIGVLTLNFADERRFTADERASIATVAQQAAQALVRAQLYRDAREANAAKGRFLATMSHELRTPLNAIGGYVDLLTVGVHGPLAPAHLDFVRRIRSNQERLLALINEVLDFAKVESGQQRFASEDVSVTDALHGVDATMRPLASAAEVGLVVECDESCVVRGDARRVQQILINLLTNALKFTPPGGTVTVRCIHRAGEQMDIEVHDTGKGIAADQLERIFQPFVQADGGPSGRRGGTGLGLAISRDLARAMGGDLRARSTVGEGSTFSLTLPACAPLVGD